MTGDVRPFGELFFEPTRNGLTRPKAVRGVGVKMVNMGELFAYPRLRNSPMDRVPLSASEAERFLLNEGDLLFARQSLVLEGAGKCSLFLKDDEPVTFESHVIRVRLDPRKADPRFYFYYLQSPHGRAAIRSIVEQGAGASGIRGSDLAALEVQWRPAGEQRAIAHILGILDDKIELNRKMNETLEAMALAIFKEWFVDAIADGLPKGWSIKNLGDVADVNWGDTNTTKASYVTNGFRAYSASGPDGFLPYHDFNRTGVVVSAIGANAGLSWLVFGKWSCIKNTIRFWAADENVSTEYLFHATLGKECWPLRGSAQPFISQGDARSMKVVIPAVGLAKRFGEDVQPLYSKIRANEEESQTLSAIRDALLPKLMSGEIRVN